MVLKHLFDRPSTVEELCDRIKVMPLGYEKGSQPATPERVGKALWYVSRKLEEVTRFRIVLHERLEFFGVAGLIRGPRE